MTTIIEFLNARLEEDEDWVSAAIEWRDAEASRGRVTLHRWLSAVPGKGHPDPWPVPVDLDRVLREIAAKRAIVADHVDNEGQCARCLDSDGVWTDEGNTVAYTAMFPCDTARALASVYAGHPDYSTDW